MKFLGILIIIIIALGGWYFFNMSEPAEQTEETDTTVEEQTQNENTSPVVEETGDTKTFDLVGSKFKFDVTEIRVKKGDTVTINFSVTDGLHDWVVDEFDASTKRVQNDETASVTFVADKAGTFEYYCSVGSHRAQGMVGSLVVEE